jgi:hypothetical protein
MFATVIPIMQEVIVRFHFALGRIQQIQMSAVEKVNAIQKTIVHASMVTLGLNA